MKPIPRPCKKCKKATTNSNGYCDQHQGDYKPPQKRYDEYRGSPSKRGYDADWRKFREWFLHLHPLCEMCLKEKRTMPTEEIHHIVPLAEGGARLDPENCMALCKSCHSTVTAEWRKENGRDK